MSKARQYGRKRTRKVKVNPETMDLLREQIERFRQKFGRDPGPEDPVSSIRQQRFPSRSTWDGIA